MTQIPDFHEEMERFLIHIPTWVGHNLNRLRGDRAKWLRVQLVSLSSVAACSVSSRFR